VTKELAMLLRLGGKPAAAWQFEVPAGTFAKRHRGPACPKRRGGAAQCSEADWRV
jgi:hypothetical protein